MTDSRASSSRASSSSSLVQRLATLSSLSSLTWAGIALRAVFLVYAVIQDRHPVIKFTDIDYSVFSDAAAFVASSTPAGSPYQRSTYRYTPLLAFLLVPNIHFASFGKLLFCACDLLAGACLYATLKHARGLEPRRAWLYTALWTLNPFVVIISTRGSAESVVAVLVVASIWGVLSGRWRLGAVLFGLAVHFKIYPVIYAVPFWFGIDAAVDHARQADQARARETRPSGKSGKSKPAADTSKPAHTFQLTLFSRRRIEFGLIAGGTFLALTYAMYKIYGQEFLDETYLYHVTRKDHRHNFSIYFYEMYLKYDRVGTAEGSASITDALQRTFGAIASFVPQLGLVAFLGVAFAHDVPFACFAQTYAFVMLNKVCTSQYFMWYICLLPLFLPHSRLTADRWKSGLGLLAAWVLGQALWLSQAFRLEHLGHNTFRELWASGAVFYIANVVVLCGCISAQQTP